MSVGYEGGCLQFLSWKEVFNWDGHFSVRRGVVFWGRMGEGRGVRGGGLAHLGS